MQPGHFYYWKELEGIMPHNEDIREDVRRLTAMERQFARADFAWDIAWGVASQFVEDHGKRYAVASALLWLEERGLYGGGCRAPGAGTKRLRFFRSLGKGRRHADDGPAWTVAISTAARKYGFLQWDLAPGGGMAVRFEPHPAEKALREHTLPLRTILFIDGDESVDAHEAWLTAASHAVREFGRPRRYGVGEQIRDIFLAAVAEFASAKEALSRARALEALSKKEGKDAQGE